MMNLSQVAQQIAQHLSQIFLPNERGYCPWQGKNQYFASNPHWRHLILFHEYFCGDTGHGLGACHQTGWTALIARLLEDCGRKTAKS